MRAQVTLVALALGVFGCQSLLANPASNQIGTDPEYLLYEQFKASGEPAPQWLLDSLFPESGQGAAERQGGDTIEDAVVITIPYSGTGTTAGYNNDYDRACPYTGSVAPDVVYSLTPTENRLVNIDLWGSSYDTKVYVLAGEETIACNDDYYPNYRSAIFDLELLANQQYFIVIDGFFQSAGDYVFNLYEAEICETPGCDTGNYENEAWYNDFDITNGGCNFSSLDFLDFPVHGEYCGTFFTYTSQSGARMRDMDWFRLTLTEQTWVRLNTFACERYAIALLEGSCNPTTVLGISTGTEDMQLDLGSLEAGEYYLFIAPAQNASFEEEAEWHLSMDYIIDPCTDATPLACGSPLSGSTANTPDCFNNPTNDALFTFTTAQAGEYQISTSLPGTDFDTFLQLYEGYPETGALVGEDDDSGNGTTSILTATLSAGVEYWVVLDGYYDVLHPNTAGNYEILLSCPEYAEANPSPQAFSLAQNYPNPFNPVTTISYSLPQNEYVHLAVYSVTGEIVAVLADGLSEAGQHNLSFRAEQLPSGVYFYRLQAGQYTACRKMILVK